MSDDGGVLQQRLQRTQAEDFIQDLFDDAVFFHQAEGRLLFVHQLGDGRANLGADALARHGGEGLQVDPVQKLAVQRELQLLVFGSVALALKSRLTQPVSLCSPARFPYCFPPP